MSERKNYIFPCGCSWPISEESTPPGVVPLLDIDQENLPRNCPATWALLGKGLTKGVFQLESPLGKQWTKKLKPENPEHISALGAILRPGCLRAVDKDGVSMTQHYCRRKNFEEPVATYHPAIDPILFPTYGVLVYQEQAMAIAVAVAGFNEMEADVLRKAIGKKLAEEMAKCRKMFIDGAEKAGIITAEMAEEVFGWIAESQRYSFNKSHSYCYGETGYDCAYVKAHVPVAFFVSWLSQAKHKQDPQEEIYELVNDAKLFDIDVLPPDLRELALDFHSADRKAINFGLADIKGVGAAQLEKLTKAIRETEQELGKTIDQWSWLEFLTRCSGKITANVVDRLIKVGSLRWLPMTRQAMLADFEAWVKMTDREQAWFATLVDIAAGRKKTSEVVEQPSVEPWWEGPIWYDDEDLPHDPKDEWAKLDEKDKEKERKKHTKALKKKLDAYQELCDVIRSNAAVFAKLSDGLRAVAKPKQEGGVATKARTPILIGHADVLDKSLTSMNDSPVWVSWVEEEYLGISLSCSKIDACDLSQVNTTCKEIRAGREGFLMLGVEIQRTREIKTKKGKTPGARMAFLTVSDGSCCLDDVVCFPSTWKEFGHLMNEGNMVIMQVERSDSGDGVVVKKVWQANQSA